MIKAVVFDCFGVLVGNGYWYSYKKLGGDQVADLAFVEDMLTKANLGQMTEDEFSGIMAAHVNKTVDEYVAAFDDDDSLNIYLANFIKTELKPHYKIGLLSNANKGTIESRIPLKILKDLFNTVIVSAEVGLVKPDPAIFELTAKRLRLKPSEIIFVDDRSDYLSGAITVGMHTILYRDFEAFKQELSKLTKRTWKV